MPAIAELLNGAEYALGAVAERRNVLERSLYSKSISLIKRINIPCCDSKSPAGLVEASTVDPFSQSGKYALGWVYFCIILLVIASAMRLYNYFTDKVRLAIHKDEFYESTETTAPSDSSYEMSALATDKSTTKFFPRPSEKVAIKGAASTGPSNRLLSVFVALVRFIFYRPTGSITYVRGWRPINLPSPSVIVIVGAALVFTILYTFIQQPLYWQSIRFGSPPIAIRSGMLAVATVPWIVGLGVKANFISVLTGIGPERLNVLHRWLSWLFLLLSLIHTVPFYVQPIYDQGGLKIFNAFFPSNGFYIYGTGIAALVPAIVLCLHSLPFLRNRFYEIFVMAHVPISIVLLAMLFWHCANFLTSWNYLWATMAIWLASYIFRLFFLNWTNPFRMSWLIGEECAVTIMQEDAVKVTIPTQVKWRPGQYVYLRMPGVSVLENHPFTIASLCSDDFPSGYGEEYRDMVLVFRPFGGFTKKVLEAALDHGPWHTYRAFIDGPYGGMRRTLHSFDHVVLIAGGSGITALVSHLLDLVKRMRDGRAITKHVHIIWALKRPDIMEWFKEELRICREYAPPDSVSCQFYITAAKRQSARLDNALTPTGPLSAKLHTAVENMFHNVANNRYSTASSNRNSAYIRDEAAGDVEREKQLRDENQDRLRPLPQAHLKPVMARQPSPDMRLSAPSHNRNRSRTPSPDAFISHETPHMPPHPTLHEKRRAKPLSIDMQYAAQTEEEIMQAHEKDQNFGFPETPTEFQKSLMRFAFMPAAVRAKKGGWSTEWGRPDLPYMLRQMSQEWDGRRACVFVCGPTSMRTSVSSVVAELQTNVIKSKKLDEIYLHAENYAL